MTLKEDPETYHLDDREVDVLLMALTRMRDYHVKSLEEGTNLIRTRECIMWIDRIESLQTKLTK